MSPKPYYIRHGTKNLSQILSSSSELFDGSYPERGMGGRKTIAGGELCVFRQQKVVYKFRSIKNMKKTIIVFAILILIAVVGLLIYLKAPSIKKGVVQESPEEVIAKVEQLMQDKNYSELWNYLHPDDKARWANKDEYIDKVQRINGSTIRKSFKLLPLEPATYQHPITKKNYTDDVKKSITEITFLDDNGKEVTEKEEFFWQKNSNSWVFFSALSSKEDGERLKQSNISSIDFKELNKEPQKYNNTLVRYNGKVIQIQESNGVGFLRMNVTKDKYGYWDDTIYVVYSDHTDAIEGDIITVYGKLTGSVDYESIAGWKMTVPSMEAFLIEKGESTNTNDNASLPKSESVSPLPTSTLPTRIEGLTSIGIGGGTWDNWDADIEKDGPVINILYLDSKGDIISNDAAKNMPISADVKLFTKDTSDAYNWKKGRLVFSAHYSKDQIINWGIYKTIRIPKEEISINQNMDYEYGYASVIVYTPEQGSFSDEWDVVPLYEK